jgi:hypothetical protein
MTTPTGGTIDSCTLPAADLPGRLAEVISPTHARLVFAADRAQAEALAGLLDRESQCCSFFTFDQRAEGDLVTVDVTVPPAHAETLSALVGRAARYLPGARKAP